MTKPIQTYPNYPQFHTHPAVAVFSFHLFVSASAGWDVAPRNWRPGDAAVRRSFIWAVWTWCIYPNWICQLYKTGDISALVIPIYIYIYTFIWWTCCTNPTEYIIYTYIIPYRNIVMNQRTCQLWMCVCVCDLFTALILGNISEQNDRIP